MRKNTDEIEEKNKVIFNYKNDIENYNNKCIDYENQLKYLNH